MTDVDSTNHARSVRPAPLGVSTKLESGNGSEQGAAAEADAASRKQQAISHQSPRCLGEPRRLRDSPTVRLSDLTGLIPRGVSLGDALVAGSRGEGHSGISQMRGIKKPGGARLSR